MNRSILAFRRRARPPHSVFVLRCGLTVLAFALAALVTLPAAATDLKTIQQNGTLRVAVPTDFPPFGSVGTDLQPQGYDIDTAKYIADQMHLKLKLVPVTSANRVPFLATGKVDLVISSLGRTPDRAKVIDFSHAYAPFYLGVFSDKADAASGQIKSAADLKGHTIGVTRGAVEDMKLTDQAPKGTTIKRFEDNATTISAFLSNQVQLIATGNQVAATIAARGGSRQPTLDFRLKNSPCYIGLAKDTPQLEAKINALIAQGLKDGTFEKLSQKWFKAPLPPGFGQNG